MSALLAGLAGALVVLIGMFTAQRKKNAINQSLADNPKVQQELNEADKAILQNQHDIAVEEGNVNNLKNKEINNVSKEDLVDFVNHLKSDK